MPRACVWCGCAPVTNEDALPQWITKRLLSRGNSLIISRVSRTGQGPPVIDSPRRTGAKLVLARRVCAACNNGWMSGLEAAAQPYLSLMMAGFAVPLSPDRQQIVATWAAKTAFMLTYGVRGCPAVHQDRLRWLYEKRTPPAGTHIWLAAYTGTRDGQYDVKHLTDRSSGRTIVHPEDGLPVSAPDAHLVTFSVDFLVVQAWTWADPLHEALPVPFSYGRANLTRRVWPPRGIDVLWPPASPVEDRGFVALSMTNAEMVEVCLSTSPQKRVTHWR